MKTIDEVESAMADGYAFSLSEIEAAKHLIVCEKTNRLQEQLALAIKGLEEWEQDNDPAGARKYIAKIREMETEP